MTPNHLRKKMFMIRTNYEQYPAVSLLQINFVFVLSTTLLVPYGGCHGVSKRLRSHARTRRGQRAIKAKVMLENKGMACLPACLPASPYLRDGGAAAVPWRTVTLHRTPPPPPLRPPSSSPGPPLHPSSSVQSEAGVGWAGLGRAGRALCSL